MQKKEWEKAEVAFKKATELKPDYAEAWNGLANTYNQQKKLDLALEASGNAAKYGGEGGWIGVFATSSADGMVEIRVADRGPGIPSSEQNSIFDPFYRGKVAVADQIHGTGLGLSLVKRIVEAHGGTVAVNSEPGKGAEFVVRIPAAPAEQIDEFADPVNRG